MEYVKLAYIKPVNVDVNKPQFLGVHTAVYYTKPHLDNSVAMWIIATG